MYKVFILILFLSTSTFAVRLDPVVVTSKTGTASSNFTSGHTILTTYELEDEVSTNLIESLRGVPGLYINQAGGPGGLASIYIRGSEVRHVLVMIDGVKVNDPSNPVKQFNAANLSTVDIERVEIIKGAQSVLYGSDAIGGVINIITKKGEPVQKLGLQLGFQNQVDVASSIVRSRGVTYLSGYFSESEGISTKKDGEEKDGFIKKGLTLNHQNAFEHINAHWMVKILQDYVEDDGVDINGQLFDDKSAYSKSLQQIYKQTLSGVQNSGTWRYQVSLNKIDREVKSLIQGEYNLSRYSGENFSQDASWIKKFAQGEAILGLSHEYETFEQSKIHQRKINLYSAYASVNHLINDKFFNVGLRNDTHELFGNIQTYNIGLGKKLGRRKQIKINHATGFKAPSLYQLYAPYDGPFKIGNEKLQPEKSRTFDLSFIQKGRSSYEITLFNNFIYDYFDYGADGYQNQGSFNSQGLELTFSQKREKLELRQGGSFSQFHLSREDHVLRRPEQKIDLGMNYFIDDQYWIALDWRWIAARYDISGKQEVTLDPYDLLNLGFHYKKKTQQYQLGINNVFNRNYEDIYDYGTLGFTVFARANFTY